MPYDDFEKLQKGGVGEAWVLLTKLNMHLFLCAGSNYNVVKARLAMKESWGKLEQAAPFSLDLRFPVHQLWVRVYDGDWPSKVEQHEMSLDFKTVNDQGEIITQINEDLGGSSENARAGAGGSGNGNGRNGNNSGGGNGGGDPNKSASARIGQTEMNKNQLAFAESVRRMKNQIRTLSQIYDRKSFESEFELHWTDPPAKEKEAATV